MEANFLNMLCKNLFLYANQDTKLFRMQIFSIAMAECFNYLIEFPILIWFRYDGDWMNEASYHLPRKPN